MIFRARGHMAAAFSADGLRWSAPVALFDLDVAGDTHNNALWAPTRERYVCFTRTWERRDRGPVRGVRLVARSESPDFRRWSPPSEVLRGLTDEQQVYSMPVFHHAGVYLGLPAVFDLRTDRVHTELAWSPDTVHWHRIEPGVPLIGNGRRRGAYDWGCVYAAAYPVFAADRVLLYYGASDDTHMSWRTGHLALASLRPDGFAGYEPVRRRGAVTTRPMRWAGEGLCLSADVRTGGSVGVEALDASGRILAASAGVRRTGTDQSVAWRVGLPVRRGRIRLRFRLERARLYSYCWVG
jgi:hypothetical protein